MQSISELKRSSCKGEWKKNGLYDGNITTALKCSFYAREGKLVSHTLMHTGHISNFQKYKKRQNTYIYSTICRKIKKCTSANPVLLNYVSDSLSCAFLNLLICIFQHKSHDLPVCLLKKKVGNRRVEST